MSLGWISIHRKFKDWEWYDDSKIVHLFLHCLLKANHKPKSWRGIQIESGQFITSRDKLSTELPLTIQQIRTALNKLKATGEITIKTTSKYSMISITNWDEYQNINQPDNQQVTSNQPASNQQVTTNNNDNNANNINNDNKELKDLFDSFWKNYPKKADKKKAGVAFNRLSKEKKEKAITDCKTRYSGTDKKYIPLATTYIHGERWDDEAINNKPADKHGGFQEKDYQSGATPQSQLEWMNDD